MRVLISGAGVAGPSLAYFLGKIGARVTVFEKAPALLPHGQNIDVNGSALAVMDKMGLLEELYKYNTTEKGTIFIDPNGRSFAPLPVREGLRSFTAATEILRGDLSLICYEASQKFPSVKYCFNTTIKQVLQNDGNIVKVETSNGDVQEYDLLVASDGQWSRVRKQCFPADSVQIVDKGMYAIYFTIPRTSEDNDWWNIYQAGKSRIITTRPDPHGTIRAMFTIMPTTEAQKKTWLKPREVIEQQSMNSCGKNFQTRAGKRIVFWTRWNRLLTFTSTRLSRSRCRTGRTIVLFVWETLLMHQVH